MSWDAARTQLVSIVGAVVPTITALRQRFDEIRRRELEKSLGGSLKGLSDRQRAALEDMTAAMINKMLHGPISQLKSNSENDEEAYKTL